VSLTGQHSLLLRLLEVGGGRGGICGGPGQRADPQLRQSTGETERRVPWLWLQGRGGKAGQRMLGIGRSSVLGGTDQGKQRVVSLLPHGLPCG